MTLEDLGNVGEFVAAIGVVLSLIYLAVQIRQNTHQLRQNSHSVRLSVSHAIKRDNFESRLPMIQDAELARIMRVGSFQPDKLDEDETMRFRLVLMSVLENLQYMFDRKDEGLFNWAYLETTIARYATLPGFADWWKGARESFGPAFIELVEREMEKTAVEPPHWSRGPAA